MTNLRPSGANLQARVFPGKQLSVRANLRAAFCVLAFVFLGAWPVTAAGAAEDYRERHVVDVKDMRALRHGAKPALELLERGEAALAEGDVARAARLFKDAAVQAPRSALLARRHCQALARLGHKGDALVACQQALTNGGSALDFRALVGALMSATPTSNELGLALSASDAAKRKMPDQPWGYAAECEIAQRLGETSMLSSCASELQRRAPGHYESERALAFVAAQRSPGWRVLIWVGIGLAALVTAGHALGRRLLAARGRPAPSLGVGLLLGVSWLLGPQSASAQESVSPQGAPPSEPNGVQAGGFSRWLVSDEDPKSSLPNAEQRAKDPLHFGYHMMDLADKSQAAAQRGNFEQAAKYYEAMVEAVPDTAVGYRKACELHEKAKNLDKARGFCKGALGAQGVSSSDYVRYAALVLAQPDGPNQEQKTDLSEIVAHLRAQPGSADLATQLDCEFGARIRDVQRLEACTASLANSAPNDPKTISYQWALALLHHDYDAAERFLERAKKSPIQPAGLEKMAEVTAQESSLTRRLARRWPQLAGAVAAVAALTVLGLGLVALLRRRAASTPRPA